MHERRLPWGQSCRPRRCPGLERYVGRSRRVRGLPCDPSDTAHGLHRVQSHGVPRWRGLAQRERRALNHLGRARGSRGRRHRNRALESTVRPPVRCSSAERRGSRCRSPLGADGCAGLGGSFPCTSRGRHAAVRAARRGSSRTRRGRQPRGAREESRVHGRWCMREATRRRPVRAACDTSHNRREPFGDVPSLRSCGTWRKREPATPHADRGNSGRLDAPRARWLALSCDTSRRGARSRGRARDPARGTPLRAERGLLSVAADARALTTRDEIVRLMAADAGLVARRAWSGRLRVACRARRDRGRGRKVGAMAIEAAFRSSVLAVPDRALFVTARAVGRDDRRRGVNLMTRGAVDARALQGCHGLAHPFFVPASARGKP
jgi:hypothetical protein